LASGSSELSRNVSETIVPRVMKKFKKFKLLRQNGFENSLKISIATVS